MSTIIEKSNLGHPPLWRLCIEPGKGQADLYFEPELIHFAANRCAIDELASVLAMHLHDLARRSGLPQ